MAKAQPCYMRVDNDDASNDQFNESIAAARESFEKQTKSLAQVGQGLTAQLFFVKQQGDETREYPDRLLDLCSDGTYRIYNT